MDDRQRCKAHSSRTGERCKKARMHGATVCGSHGGRARQVKGAADRRRVETAVWDLVTAEGVEEIADPVAEFQQLVAEARAFQKAMQKRIADLSEWRYRSDLGAEQLRSEVALYERAMDRVAKLLADWQRLGFESRMVQVQEAQQRETAEFMRRVVAAFGIPDTPETWETIRAQWKVIEGGQAS